MPNSNPPEAPPLALPPAVLHATRPSEPHPDSEEAVARERQRVAQELQPIESPPSDGDLPALRSRSSHSRSQLSESPSRERSTSPSAATTGTDPGGPNEQDVPDSRPRRQVPRWYHPVVRFWTTHVSLTVDMGSQRDHLALERTFLGYLRSSLAFSMASVLIAQLFRLQRSDNPHPTFGFYVLGKPLALIFIAYSIITLLIGAWRFWKVQNAMVRGKAHAGGWNMVFISVATGLLFVAVFALLVGVDVHKEFW